jgi:peptide/nickel transport system ATP-binding protein
VACHWVEEIADGRIRPHEVDAELVRPEVDIGAVPQLPTTAVP